ncbi:hypothetical protein [Nonomuraea sp. NPDC050643]|uniref:hypothetical protein n=1 Tax=Nonomuraea sp. NPDC050643 TaxID=3155660 RepID=UPI003405F5E2
MRTRLIGAALIVVAVGVIIVTLIAMGASLESLGTLPAIAALFVAAFGLGMLVTKPSPGKHRYDDFMRSAEWPPQRDLIRKIWSTVRSLPDGWQATDPDTRHMVGVIKDRIAFILVVRDPIEADPAVEREALATYYFLGMFGRLVGGPLFHRVQPVHEEPPEKQTWEETAAELDMADQTGTADTPMAELIDLHARVVRTVRATGVQ